MWLASSNGLEAKELPGDSQRTGWNNAILSDARRLRRDPFSNGTGTWEDWIDWATDALANGHDSWAVEVEPELTVQALYEREILHSRP